MPDLRITVDGSERQVAAGTTAAEVFEGDRSVIAARVGGELRDLAHVLADGDAVLPIAIDSEDGRSILRHSTAHVMAQAVQELHPDARLGIGPPIENGFYYDFDVETPFTPEDLSAIEKRMQQIVKEGQSFVRREVADDEARTELAAEPYKLELIGLKGGDAANAADGADAEVGAGELTIYDNVRKDGSLAWKDLCRGPHLPTTRHIPAFKLIAGRPRPTGGAARRTRSCSASTAPRGRPGTRSRRTSSGWPRPRSATTASSAPSSTCSRSPTSSAPAWPCSTPRAA